MHVARYPFLGEHVWLAHVSSFRIGDYMSIGRTTISNRYGDIKLVFDEYRSGLLADCDSQDFAPKITTVLENPSLASEMGKNARRVAETKFSWQNLIKRLEEFYFQILEH